MIRILQSGFFKTKFNSTEAKTICLLISIVIYFSQESFAQVDATNNGTMYVSSGTTVSFEASFTNSGTGNHINEGYEYIKKNWTNNGSFLSEAGKVTFWGSSVQNISGSVESDFFDADFNNASGFTLSQTIGIAGTLGLISGNITTSSYEVNVTNNLTNAINPYSENSYIIGNLRRSVSSSGEYFFPVGTSSYYELASLNLNSISGFDNVLGKFTNAIPNPTGLPAGLKINGTPITDMLDYGYWTLTPNSSLTGGNFTVKLNERGASNMSSPASIYGVIERVNSGSSWQSQGTHVNSTQYISGGTVHAERSAVNVSSDYGIGFPQTGYSLPLELLSFDAVLNKDVVDLTWVTASELNSDYFTIERSADGIHFTDLLSQKAAGNSTHTINYADVDEQPLFGFSYYRLRQTDFNREVHYSQIETIYYQPKSFDFEVLPNPTTADNINLKITGAKGESLLITLSDVSGKKYSIYEYKPDSEISFIKIKSSAQLAAGYYLTEIILNGKIYSKPVIIQ